jgi:hypothetical protein
MAVVWKKVAYADEVGLFEIDVDGGLMPVTDILADTYFELDGDDNLMPKAA